MKDLFVNTNLELPRHLRLGRQKKDENTTVLAKLIWERDWSGAENRIKSNNNFEVCQEISLSGLPSSVESLGFPLHLACSMRPLPPASLVETLVEAFPEACRMPEQSRGLLPLHLASDLSANRTKPEKYCYSSGFDSTISGDESPRLLLLSSESSEWEAMEVRSDILEDNSVMDSENHSRMVQHLIDSYPEAVYATDSVNGMLPLHVAASTARSENGVVSPTSAAVLEALINAAPKTKDVVDGHGDSPVELAWRLATFCCYRCGKSGAVPCSCKSRLSVEARFLHPLLRDDIHSVASPQMAASNSQDTWDQQNDFDEDNRESRGPSEESPDNRGSRKRTRRRNLLEYRVLENDDASHVVPDEVLLRAVAEYKRGNRWHLICNKGNSDARRDKAGYIPQLDDSSQHSQADKTQQTLDPESSESEGGDKVVQTILSQSTLDMGSDKRESRESVSVNLRQPILQNLNGIDATKVVPSMNIQLHLTKLRRPIGSNNPRRAPNPYYEVYVTDGNSVASRYQSYPLMRTCEGTWDEATIELTPLVQGMIYKDLLLQREENNRDTALLHNRLPPAKSTNWQIGIRVLHCKRKGGQHCHVIGLCRTTLEQLKLEPWQPILHGFQVMGWLEVKKLEIM